MISTLSRCLIGKNRNISENIDAENAKKLQVRWKKNVTNYLPFRIRLYSLSLPSTSKAFCMPESTENIT